MILEYAKEFIQRKTTELPRNLLRALASSCGLPGVRAFVVTRIEQWLHNPKCARNAQELLLYLCVNSKCSATTDIETVAQISKLRMKTKQLTQFYSMAMR